jgi:hypothetical protein
MSVDTEDGTLTAGSGEIVHMPKGSPVTIRSHEAAAVTAYVPVRTGRRRMGEGGIFPEEIIGGVGTSGRSPPQGGRSFGARRVACCKPANAASAPYLNGSNVIAWPLMQ